MHVSPLPPATAPASSFGLRTEPLTSAEQLHAWAVLCADRAIQDLPYKIETDAYGGLRLSPAQSKHARTASRVYDLLKAALGDTVITELPIVTDIGIKVVDVAWCSAEFMHRHWSDTVLTRAPEICVEVVSPSNSEREMREKMAAYLSAGAKEVWIVADSGRVAIHTDAGARPMGSQFPVDPASLGAQA